MHARYAFFRTALAVVVGPCSAPARRSQDVQTADEIIQKFAAKEAEFATGARTTTPTARP